MTNLIRFLSPAYTIPQVNSNLNLEHTNINSNNEQRDVSLALKQCFHSFLNLL